MVGISLDGDRAANDLHRRYADGRSSYDQVMRAVGAAPPGALPASTRACSRPSTSAATRSPSTARSPTLSRRTSTSCCRTAPGTARRPEPAHRGRTRYADWLDRRLRRWARDGRRVPVRIFESIIATSLRRRLGTESLGLDAERRRRHRDRRHDRAGRLDQGRLRRRARDRPRRLPAPARRRRRPPGHQGAAAGHRRPEPRPAARCPVVTSCGGGLYAHRYRTGSGFEQPLRLLRRPGEDHHARAGGARPPGSDGQGPLDAPARQLRRAGRRVRRRRVDLRLNAAQRSVQRALLRLLRERASRGRRRHRSTRGWDLLTRLDRPRPAPSTRCSPTRTCGPGPSAACAPPGAGCAADAGHLASIAAAAAIRSGTLAELDVPVTDGYVHLPTLGRLRVGDAATATLAVPRDGVFEVRAALGQVAGRADAPRGGPGLAAGPRAARRAVHGPPRGHRPLPGLPPVARGRPADRRGGGRLAGVSSRRPGADRAGLPAYAPGLAAGLSTLMPLANDVPGREISAAARQAFGAVAAALPAERRGPGAADHPRVPARQARRDDRHVRPVRPDRPAAVLRSLAGGPAPARRPAAGHVRAHRASLTTGACGVTW